MTLYISDLDGTLLNYKGELKGRTCEMLNRMTDDGLSFSIATARGKLSALEKIKELKLKLPIICMNGVFIYDPVKDIYIVKNLFTAEQIIIIAELLAEKGEKPLVYSFINGEERVSYIKGSKTLKKYLAERKYDKRQRPCDSYAELFEGEIFYITMINPASDLNELDDIFCKNNGFMRTSQSDYYDKNEIWYEIFRETATKGNAVALLKAICKADEIVSFGDSENDIEMFRESSRSYAVRGACDRLKAIADAVIDSNDCCGVPRFIEREYYERFSYKKRQLEVKPDTERFRQAVEAATNRETVNIGTLNEKCIHSALKYYYSDNQDHEAKIGSFYADIVNENGITEIQTANFGKLNKKLEVMLRACHVTVVYPYEKRVINKYIDINTGELIKTSPPRTNSSLTKFFLELYRIKSFLTNPNLTICVAEITVEKINYINDIKSKSKRSKSCFKTPVELRREIYLEDADSFRFFLPENMPETFTVKDFKKLCKCCDPKLMLEILEYSGICEKNGRTGNSLIYKFLKNY